MAKLSIQLPLHHLAEPQDGALLGAAELIEGLEKLGVNPVGGQTGPE